MNTVGQQELLDHLSVSSISMLQRCPKQFEFRYIHGIKSPPAVALVEGGSVHRGLEALNKFYIGKGRWPADRDVFHSAYYDEWKKRSKEVEEWGDENPQRVEKRGHRLLDHYYDHGKGGTNPQQSELGFATEIAGQRVVGYFDLVETQWVSDYKVVGRTPSQSDVQNSQQLGLYAVLTGRRNARIGALVKTTAPLFVWLEASFNLDAWAAHWQDLVARSVAQIKAGAFPPTDPKNWCCSERFCGFWKMCRGAKHPKRSKYVVKLGGDPANVREDEKD